MTYAFKNDRRRADRNARDRRHSARWRTDKPFTWRVERGRRSRRGRIAERSLHGFAMIVEPSDLPTPGTRILAVDDLESDRLGIRSAVVRRVIKRNFVPMLIAEIES